MRSTRFAITLVLACGSIAACAVRDEAPPAPAAEAPQPAAAAAAPVVEVTARDYAFQAPDEIPSGWTSFRFANTGREPHFFLLTRLPEDKTLADYRDEVVGVFEDVWAGLRDRGTSQQEAGAQLGARLPDWYLHDAVAMGGVGLTSPGNVGRTTMRLDPGHYVMECYVKNAGGVFHGTLGMLRALTVTADDSGHEEPAGDLEVSLSNGALAAERTTTAGHHTVAVHYLEQPAGGLGNDVHLVRLEPDTDTAALARWMNWMNVGGLRTPAPAAFLGGAEEMPAGHTAYFEVDLEPGRYAWIMEPGGRMSELTVE